MFIWKRADKKENVLRLAYNDAYVSHVWIGLDWDGENRQGKIL